MTLLRDGPGTFEAMLAMIDAAQETVEFEGYIYRRDEIGMRFAKAFVDAAERGVRVRVGSTDFNPLSVSINSELDAVIEDAALGTAAEAMFLEDLQKSKELRLARSAIRAGTA